jgi:hypothetical protein
LPGLWLRMRLARGARSKRPTRPRWSTFVPLAMALSMRLPHSGSAHARGPVPRGRAHAARTFAAAAAPPKLGTAVTDLLTVPACKGLAVKVAKGQMIKVINTYGAQVRSGARTKARVESGPLQGPFSPCAPPPLHRLSEQHPLLLALTYVCLFASTHRCVTSGASEPTQWGQTDCYAPS